MAEGITRSEAPSPVAVKDRPIDVKRTAVKTEPEPLKSEPWYKRRKLIKGVAAAALGLTGATVTGAIAEKELKAIKEGITTEHAVFVPLYESHDNRLKASQIPADLDVLFKEGTPKNLTVDTPPHTYITLKEQIPASNGQPATPTERFSDGSLEKIAQNNIKIAPADINFGLTADEANKMITARSAAEFVAAFSVGGYAFGKDLVDGAKDIVTSPEEVSRRKMLKIASFGMAGAAASYIGTKIATNLTDNLEQTDAIKRVVNRINGFQSNFHPEDLAVFVRNVFIANKLLTVAEQLKSEKNQKLKIGFNYGGLHNGIEDMLQAGPDFCRIVISNLPKEYLASVIQANSSAENLSSVLLIDLPGDFKSADVTNPRKLVQIQSRKVMDVKLLDKLRSVPRAA